MLKLQFVKIEELRNKTKIIVVGLSLILYFIAFIILHKLLKGAFGSIVFLLPLILSSWFWGQHAGIIMSIIGVILNLVIMIFLKYDVNRDVLSIGIGIMSYTIIALIVGHLVQLNERLRNAITQIKTLQGLIPICASCKKIRNDKGYWQTVESYIQQHSDADFSHGICPECLPKLYPKYYKKMEEKLKNNESK